MKAKPIVPRALALQDVDAAISHYASEGGAQLALGFIASLEAAFAHLGRQPASGSTRHAHELGLPGLRTWRLGRFPYLVFYVERADHVDVWRVLHGARDIPAWLQDPGDAST